MHEKVRANHPATRRNGSLGEAPGAGRDAPHHAEAPPRMQGRLGARCAGRLGSEELDGIALFEGDHGLLPGAGLTELVAHALRLRLHVERV